MQSIKGKKLLLLGSMPVMKDVIDKARELGVYTIVTDYNDPKDFPVKKHADEYRMISYSDFDAIYKLIEEENIDGVYTQFNDSALPYCQHICEHEGFPFFLNADQVYQISNKEASKNLCLKYGIPVSKEYHLTEEFKDEDVAAIEWPVLTKPTDNSGQRGITICHDLEELKKGYEYAKENCKEGKVIIEEYMQGDYVVINFTLQDGELYLSCLADKPVVDEAHSNGMIRLPKGYIMPSKYINLLYEKRFENFRAFAKGLGLKNGSWGVECIVRNNDFYVFEMQFRLGGMRHYTFVQAENGIDILEMHIRYALTGEFDAYDLSKLDNPYFKKTNCLLNVILKEGTKTNIRGMESICDIPEIESYSCMHQIGDTIELSGSVFQIFLKASIVTESYEQLIKVLTEIQNKLQVEDENGENMVLPIV